MDLSGLAGNAPLKRQLEAQTARRGLSHAYILSGPKGAGKRTLGRILAAAWVCTGPGGAESAPCGRCSGCKKVFGGIHPDVTTIGSDGKDITVAQVRALRADAYIRPNEAERKVYVLENAQTMNASAQNAMLKLLEEGPAYAAFLLLTDNAAALLETVRSRCEILSLSPAAQPEPEEDERQARDGALALLGELCKGDELSLMEFAVGLEKWDRDSLAALFSETVLLLRGALIAQKGGETGETEPTRREAAAKAAGTLHPRRILDCIAVLERLRAACGFNAGAGHVAGWLCAALSSR